MSVNRINICDLVPKEAVESTYLVKYIAVMEAKDQKKYLNVILADGTGDIEARVWNDAEEIFSNVDRGNFVKVEGKTNLYQGRKQFIIQKIQRVDEKEINREDFVIKAKVDADVMYDELLKIVNELKDVYVRDLLLAVLQDNEIARRLKIWQAGKSIHHAYQAGLLEHILSCAKLAISLSPHYGANENYVVAGAILHDLCKIYELTDGVNVEYTEEGKLVGHLVKGLEIVDRFSYRIKDFPYPLKMHLKHILLSHHGEYEYGSPKIPQTSEAMLVHLIDLMDSKMHTFETIKRTDNAVGHWSGYIKHLDRIIFKDDLPFYPEYVEGKPDSKKTQSKTQQGKPKRKDKELKQNMSNLLKDFKVED
jgi:3'-5' exoribonuclease